MNREVLIHRLVDRKMNSKSKGKLCVCVCMYGAGKAQRTAAAKGARQATKK
jgi:hypothetical protein